LDYSGDSKRLTALIIIIYAAGSDLWEGELYRPNLGEIR
jgi:hypothetical protein